MLSAWLTQFKVRELSYIKGDDFKNQKGKAAMQNLGYPNKNEALSVDARQELDLRIGCAFTRFQTKFFHQKYGDLDSSLISFGPCQTPTLGFCVTRYDQIQSFKPESYWIIQVVLKTLGKSSEDQGLDLKPEWSKGRIFDKDVCQYYLEKIKSNKQAVVIDVSSEERSKAKPIALNTVELMRIASSGLGMGPSQSMSIAEHLYTQGFISYPRTETTQYPDNFDLMGVVKDQTGNRSWGDYAKLILTNGIKKPKKGVDAGDHPPITPMKGDSEGRLAGDHGRLYEYIVKHFLATVSEDCKYLLTTARLKLGDEEFSLSGKTLISAGFTEILSWQAVDNDEKMPPLLKNDKLDLVEAKLVERQTSPPDYLTESELITLMEKHGIGTDASIPVHINNIRQRNYVTVSSQGRRLIPTSLGIVLVHGYWKIDPDLCQPKMRAAVEEQLNLIAKGKATYKSVTEHALKIFRMKFEYFVKNIEQMDELFEVSFTSLSDSGKPFTRCGICRRYMKLISARPTRLHCPTCQQTYSLPQARDAVIRPHSDQKCPLDDFEIIYWFGGGRTRGFTLCPYCYNNPPFPGMAKHQGKSPSPGKKDVHNGCLFCDEEFKGQVDQSFLQLGESGGGFGGSFGGRGGRGRRGRGGGRGRGRGRGGGSRRSRGRSGP